MSFIDEDPLVDALREHNPWWADGATALSPHLPARERSDFYHLVRPDEPGSQFEDQQILGLVGRQGVGKTTLLEQFVYERLTDGAEPERFCYLPFDANPLYQLGSDDQLDQAIRYYESRVLGHLGDPEPHFLILDDVHYIEHQHKDAIDGWGTPISETLDSTPGRHIVVTASAGIHVDRELERVDIPESAWDTQPILPEKFRDYLFSLYPPLEEENRRVSPTPIRKGPGSLPAAIETGDATEFVETLQDQYDRVSDRSRRIQSQVVHYLAMGGIISYAEDGAIEDAASLDSAAYDRLRDDLRHTLYQEVPAFESVQTIADLERLCALAARNRGVDPVRYQRLVEAFDVDRRTIRDRYFDALSKLYLLTPTTEYDNARPRSVRLYLRDTGLLTALTTGEPEGVLHDREQEAALARVAAFDHTKRLAYNMNEVQETPVSEEVGYWQDRAGTVDFVFQIDDTPIPIALGYRPSADTSIPALHSFIDEYDTPFGIRVVGDTVAHEEGIEYVHEHIVQIPYWFYLMLC